MIIVFYLDAVTDEASAEHFLETDLLGSLAKAEELRKSGMRHVCISAAYTGSVGKAGVSSVEGGLTPDGEKYSWAKRR